MLFRWQQKYDEGGPVALETKKTPGPASRLSPTQLSKLYAIITGSDPRQLQFEFGLWTRKIIRDLIRREFGVKFSGSSKLTGMGFWSGYRVCSLGGGGA
jgi:transposase